MNRDLEARKTGPRACGTCARAKARCVPCTNSLKCERCDRLNKSCSEQTPAPPRPRKRSRASRVTRLERKLDDLNSHLNAAKGTPQENPHVFRRKDRGYSLFDHVFVVDQSATVENTSTSKADVPRSATNANSSNYSPRKSWPTGEEAQTLLDYYRVNGTPSFPFIVLPADIPWDQFKSERPFLWKAVMIASLFKDGNRQFRLGRGLLKDLSEALLLNPIKSVDLLQGLMLFLGCFRYALNSLQVTNFLGLARSLCLSLGFDEGVPDPNQSDYSSSCLEKLRTYAGVYYLVTIVFTTSRRTDALMNTAHLTSTCDILARQAQYPSDRVLVQLIRIQQLAQEIAETTPAKCRATKIDQVSTLPLIMIIRTFQARLADYNAALSPDLRENTHLSAHVHIAEALLYEVSLQETQEGYNLSDTDRLELLWALLCAAKSYIHIRLRSPRSTDPKFLCISSIDLMYAFITCLKLSTLQAPGWDLALVRQEVVLEDLIEQQIQDLNTTVGWHSDGLESSNESARKLVRLLRNVKEKIQALPRPASISAEMTQVATPPIDENGSVMNTLMEIDIGSWKDIWDESLPDLNSFDMGFDSYALP